MAEKSKHNSSSGKKRANGQRKYIVAIIIIITGVLMLLSILSYSRADDAVLEHLSLIDVFRLPFNNDVKILASELQNKLGLLGAIIADFFVLETIGYTSIIIPILLIMWAWIIVRKHEQGKIIKFTNYVIVGGILLSTTFGLLNLVVVNTGSQWSGLVGAFLADILTRLLGKVGAPIVVVTALFITIILAIDLDIHKTIERFKSWALFIGNLLKKPKHSAETIGDDEETIQINTAEEKPFTEDINKIPVIESENESDNISVEEKPEEEILEPEVNQLGQEFVDENEEIKISPESNVPSKSNVKSDHYEIDYVPPSIDLLDSSRYSDSIPEDELKANAELVREKLANFGVEIVNVSVTPGPVVTLYELVPASDVKISRIVNLADDLALALAAKGIRIMAPIPGKSAVGVEIPNKNPSIVSLRSVINSAKFRDTKAALPLAIGKTISGEVYTDDLAKMPHLLIAGSTGSGKSVGINTIITSLLYRLYPSDVKFIIIDPKKIELSLYSRLKYHFLAVSPDINEEIITTPQNAVVALRGVEMEMEERYNRLASAGVRGIEDYNERLKEGILRDSEDIIHRKMPYLIVVIDELADLMMTAAREVEEPIARLAQLARAVGIHLVLATQRPSVDVITGVIKANFPARIAYQVASKIDSRTILDMNGAEQLLGNGDMLFLPAKDPKPIRIQNAYISTQEVERVTEFIGKQKGYPEPYFLPSIQDRKKGGTHEGLFEQDELFLEAAKMVVRHQQGSVSLLQRRLKVGYSRAARLMDELEAAEIVGPYDGSKPREVLVENEEQLKEHLKARR